MKNNDTNIFSKNQIHEGSHISPRLPTTAPNENAYVQLFMKPTGVFKMLLVGII